MVVVLVFVASFLAFILSLVAGGGAGLVLVPLLRLILPVASIPGALSIGTAASSVSRIWLFATAFAGMSCAASRRSRFRPQRSVHGC